MISLQFLKLTLKNFDDYNMNYMDSDIQIDLSQLVEEYTGEMYQWACYKVSNTELAKDLVQDTFLAAAEKIDTFKGKSSPKTWLYSILNNKIVDVYRKKVKQAQSMDNEVFSKFFNDSGEWKKDQRPLDWDDQEGHLLDDAEFQTVLQKCLNALPEKWNLCVKLKYLTGKSGDEICQDLDITSSNYWQMIHRAKLQLRNCVETNWFKG